MIRYSSTDNGLFNSPIFSNHARTILRLMFSSRPVCKAAS